MRVLFLLFLGTFVFGILVAGCNRQTIAAAKEPEPTIGPDSTAAAVKESAEGGINVRAFGAKGDARAGLDGVVNGTTTFVSASANFTAADIGKLIDVADLNGAIGVTIVQVLNSKTAIMSAPATGSANPASWTLGTDDSVALQAAIDAVPSTGGSIHFPAGTYLALNGVTITHNGTFLYGDGRYISRVQIPTNGVHDAITFLAVTGTPSGIKDMGAVADIGGNYKQKCLRLSRANAIVIEGNWFNGCQWNVYIDSSSTVTVEGNESELGVQNYGVTNSEDVHFVGNMSFAPADIGYYLFDGPTNPGAQLPVTFSGDVSYLAVSNGLFINHYDNVVVSAFTAANQGNAPNLLHTGIHIADSSGVSLNSPTVHYARDQGIFVEGTARNISIGNPHVSNQGMGSPVGQVYSIYVGAAENININGGNLYNSQGNGLYFAATGAVTGLQIFDFALGNSELLGLRGLDLQGSFETVSGIAIRNTGAVRGTGVNISPSSVQVNVSNVVVSGTSQ